MKRLFKKLSKKVILGILAILIIGTPLLYLTLLNSNPAQAAWWDDNWLYRQRADITNSSGSNLTDFQVSITLDTSTLITAGKMQTNCGDIRITDNTGTLLDYWIDKATTYACNTTTTNIWVKISSLPTSGVTLYAYYGNPTASTFTQDGSKVFIFFDDFDDNAIDSTKWTTQGTGTMEETSNQMHILAGAGGWTLARFTTTQTQNLNNTIIEHDFKIVNTSWNEPGEIRYGNLDVSTNYWSGFFGSDKRYQMYTLQSGSWAQRAYPTYVFAANTTYHSKVIETGTTVQQVITEGATSRIDTGAINHTTNTSSYLHMMDAYTGDESNRDNFRIRKYTSTEPSSSLASEEKAPGPKLYWQFDDPSAGSGLVAQDSSSNNLDGTLNNTPAWNMEDLCLSGKCLYFDGSNNENVSRADNALLDFVAADNFTLSAWVRKSGAASANTVILGKASANIGATYQGYKLYMDASGDFCFDTQDGTLAVDTACTSAVEFDDDKWHLVQGVKTGTTNITLYVDGKQRAQDASIASTGSLANSGTFYAGIDSDGLAIEWKGFIDEVKIYDYARSNAQILTDFNSRSSLKGSSAQIGSPDQWKSLSEGLVGYWKLDESSGNAADSSGNGTTLTNNNTTAFAGGKFGNSGSFTAASLHYFSTASTISGVKTVSFWVNPSANTDEYINLTASAYITSSSGTLSATGFTSPSIYVNGVLNGTITASAWNHVVVTTDTAINANAFEAGRANSSYINGTMDEIRLYNRVLTLSEVEGLYNFAPGPVGYWNFEEKGGQSAYDIPNGNTGTLGADSSSGADDPAWTSGKIGGGLNFDGSNDYVNVPYNGVLNTSSALTLSAWIKTTSTSRVDIISRYAAANPNPGYSLTLAPSYTCGSAGQVGLWVGDNTNKFLCTTSTVNDGKWHHIVGTYDGTTAAIYVDGVSQASGSRSNSLSETAQSLKVGASGDLLFYGNTAIDDVKIYNYARTQKQIVSDMNAGHPAVGTPVASAVAYWDFDEGYGTSASDFTGNSNTLTLSSASWTNSGKFGKAWNGTGALWLSRADDADFDFTASESFAVSLWYKTDSANNPGATEYLVSKGPLSTAGYGIYANTDGTVCFGIDDDITWNPDISSCTSTDVYDNTWHHVIGVRDVTADKTLIYIDGVLKDSDTDSTSETLANSSSLYIGDSNGADGTDEFNGDIDEVKIYRYALTSDEVKIEYNKGSSLVLGAAGDNSTYQPNAANQEYCIPGDTASCTAPVGRWDFEEGTGTTVNDTSGTGNTGTWNGTSNHWVTGKYGRGGSFDGSNDYISLTSTPTTGTGSFSIFAWIKTSSTSTRKQIVSYGSDTTNQGEWFFVNTSNQVESDLSNTAGPSSTATVTDGKWHHVGVVNSSGSFQIYVDGQTSGSSSSMSPNIGTTNTPVIGSGMGANLSNWRFNGRIDDVRIYNYARSVAQVALDYNRGKPIAYWDLDECQGSSVYDLSGNNNTGTITIGASGTQTSAGTCLTSGTAWGNGASGKRNYSLNFDGTDDRVSAATSTTIPSISASAWVKLSAFNDPHNPIVMLDSSGGSCGAWCESFYFIVGSAGKFAMARFYSWGVTGKAWDCTNASCSLTTSKWYHIAFSQDGNNSNTVNFYINGVLVQSVTSPQTTWGAGTYPTTGNSFKIGGNADMGGYYTPGQIDDVKIYNYALTATQIKELYNQGAVFFGPTTGSP